MKNIYLLLTASLLLPSVLEARTVDRMIKHQCSKYKYDGDQVTIERLLSRYNNAIVVKDKTVTDACYDVYFNSTDPGNATIVANPVLIILEPIVHSSNVASSDTKETWERDSRGNNVMIPRTIKNQ